MVLMVHRSMYSPHLQKGTTVSVESFAMHPLLLGGAVRRPYTVVGLVLIEILTMEGHMTAVIQSQAALSRGLFATRVRLRIIGVRAHNYRRTRTHEG